MQSCLALIPDDIKRVYLAYSGGLDSSVLLHLLATSPHRFALTPWHINHGLQDAAKEMEQFCIQQVEKYQLEIRIDRLDLGSIDSNIEAEARRQRYSLFEAVSESGDCIVTAHHADDQAETFLLNALRGSGSAGLRGIAQSRQLGESQLLRPLLEFSRQQLEDYANRNEIAWFNDPSNRNSRFDRNYLRHEVIPSIRTRWPQFQLALSKASQLQSETQQILDDVAQQDYLALSRTVRGNEATLALDGLLLLSAARARNLLRHWVAVAGLASIPGARLHEIMKQIHARPSAMPQIKMQEYSIRLYDQRLFLVRHDDRCSQHGSLDFGSIPQIDIDDLDIHIRRDQLFEQLALQDQGQQLILRFRHDGDHSTDRHRLKRLFQKHRIPPWQRQSTAQVYLDGKLVGLLT